MATNDSTTRLLKTVVATGLMLVVGWLVAPTLTSWHSRGLASQLTERIADARDSHVKAPLRQMADLGETAIEPLVVAATSEREAVATVARQILDEKLATWEGLPETSFTATLATALATHIEEFGPAGKQWAEQLALTIIERTDQLPVGQTQILLEHCNQILAAVPPRGPKLRTLTTRTKPRVPKSPAPEPSWEPLTHASEASLDEAPVRSLTRPRRHKEVDAAFPPVASDLQWSLRRSREFAMPSQTPLPSAPLEIIPNNRLTILPMPTRIANSKVVDIPNPQDMAKQGVALRELSSKTLLLRFSQANFYEAGIIRAVLVERGFDDAELALRQQLASPEIADRLRLVEEVSQLSAAKARRVLRWLLEDSSGDVRLRALTALATTSSADLSELARGLAANDEDPRVAKLASRLLRQSR